MKGESIICFVTLSILGFSTGTPEDVDFPSLVKTKTFVDKTQLIQELFINEYAIITAPRGFGKSTNVQMMKTFLEIVVDSTGQPFTNVQTDENGKSTENPEKELTNNFKLFKENNLKIYENKTFFYQHCGTHPVIYISFKAMGQDTHQKVVKEFKLAVSRSFEEHRHLVQKWADGEEDKIKFLKYLEVKNHNDVTIPEAQIALTFLSRVLNEHYRRKPIVLIDEYDTPILDAIYNSHKEFKKTIEFIRVVYSHLLIENKNVQRCLISATNVKLARILSVYTDHYNYYPIFPNEFEYYPFLSVGFSDFYGLTLNEVENLLKKFEQSENLEKIIDWYGGYTVKNMKIFNSFSVLHYLKNSTFGGYWTQYDSIRHLKEIFLNPKIQEKIHKLLTGEDIILENDIKINEDYVESLYILFESPLFHKLTEDNIDYANCFINFLTDNGYFNKIHNEDQIKLRIPNKEIADEFAEKLHMVTFYVDTYYYAYPKIEEFVDRLVLLDEKIENSFKIFTESVAGLYQDDVIMPKNNFEFYAPLYVFAKTFGKFKFMMGESHAIGPHGVDILMIKKDGRAIIIQTKYKAGSALDGLKEIFNQGYDKLIKHKYDDVTVKTKFYIGLHLSEDRKATVSYLIDSNDIEKAVHVSS